MERGDMAKRLSVIKRLILLMGIASYFTSLAISGDCQVVGEECIEAGEERMIDGFNLYKGCWRKRFAYKCEGYAKNDCGEYDNTTYCHHQGEPDCKAQLGNWCVAYAKKFICEEPEEIMRQEKRYRIASIKRDSADINKVKCGENIRCIDGKCFNQSYETNNEMNEAIAGLAALKEMQRGFDKDNLSAFKGKHRYCSKRGFGLNKCCNSGKSTVEKIGLSRCEAGEKELTQLKAEGKCHYVGEYTEKMLGFKKAVIYNFCCFESELAKEIQVQGRAQLGRGWGSAEHPDCSGVGIEKEFSKLQFDKMDFNFMKKHIDPTTIWEKLGSMRQAMQTTADILEDEFNTIKSSWDNKGSPEEREEDQLNNDDEDESYLRKPDGRDETLDDKKPWGGE
jgi:conjugal transfer mating pair stabilization protein TraN